MQIHRSFKSLLPALLLAFAATPAAAVTIDFSDYIGQAVGNSATLEASGFEMLVTAAPSHYDLSISSVGLGVECTGSRWGCLGNSDEQIDASHGESVLITFTNGPVEIHSADLLSLYDPHFGDPEAAQITAGRLVVIAEGEEFYFGEGDVSVDLGGVVADSILVEAVDPWYSNVSLKSLTIYEPGTGSTDRPGGGNGPAVPEPGAALAFGLGALVIGRARIRR